MTYDARFLRRPLTVALAAALTMPALALAQSSDSDDDTDDAETSLDRITVVGSRIKRAQIEGPAPITVITRADIDREGFQTVGDVLQTLNQNTTASFTGDEAVTGFSPNAQVVNLRNLGPGYTLTLINGRRPAQYPQPYNRDNNVVNVRAIPTSVVERIEVLSGGASAIYGADAVAGVVNIVTRTNFEGNTIRGTIGTTAEGGGDSLAIEVTGGSTGERWNWLYALQAGYNEPIFANQRKFLADTRNGPLGPGFTNPALSLVVIRASASPAGPTNHESFYPGEDVCNEFGYTTVTTAARGTYCGSFNQVASRSVFNKGEAWSAYSYGTFDLSDSTQLFASVNYYNTKNKGSSGTEFWGTSGDRFNVNEAGAATPFFFDPEFGHLVQLQRIFNPFELGGEEAAATIYNEYAYEILLGAQGSLGDRFDWEAFVSHGVSDYELDRPRLLAQAVHDYFVGPVQGYISGFPIASLNRDRWVTPITPEIYRSFATRVANVGDTSSSTVQFNMSGDLFDMPAGPVGFAGVLEGHRQTVDLDSDFRLNPLRPADSQTVYNLVSSGDTKGTRDRYALGVEFRVPIFSKLTAQLAARYDKYNDISNVDDAITYQAGLEFRPLDRLLLRANYATSFKAPDMQIVYAEGAASFSGILDEYACRAGIGRGAEAGPRTVGECNVANDPTIYTAQTTIAGNPGLKEEEGTSYTAGFVWDIVDNLSFTADYWRVKLEDAAGQLTAAVLLRDEANCRLGVNRDGSPFEFDINSLYCQNILGLVTRQSAPGTIADQTVQRINSAYINRALLDNSGIDASLDWRVDTDSYGQFFLSLGYSLVLTDKDKQFSGDPVIDRRDFLSNLNGRSRVRGSVSWRKGDWDATVFGTRYGSVGNWLETAGCNAAGTCWEDDRLQPYMLYNLTVGKRWGESFRTNLSVVNVFDNQYRKDPSQTTYPFYYSFFGSDPRGRRFFATAEYRF